MKVLAVVPARGGSKGIPRKNIRKLAGRPLLSYTIDAIEDSKLLSRSIMSSDDPEIMEMSESLGLEVPFVRPGDLAGDKSPTLPVILHALDHFLGKGIRFDAVCILQLTSPFRRKGLIDEAITLMKEKDFDSVISVLPVPHEFNPHWVFESDENNQLRIATGEKEIISRRQDLPPAYFRDGGLYLTKTGILRQNTLYGNKIGYVFGEKEKHVNLDTMEDWNAAEELAAKIYPKS
ncbi:cytidylyltransferase domain-containing protein [Algoriphagus sediminis]|uniref:Acylneuraminate cytidylyltransferase family protein n=1 Tax=Algoriphagus sediminis TaxID=3057113 RepID=A0ABT7YDZ7_9BACT|nr:acylneuraminate cytidylyltransferase family protein [Algoriphagus sediminis]MDN3204743.1 acylneuraminate cytidylyltransferase family protein [Algoriphagus sediminis]